MAAVQWSRNRQLSPYGLLLADPERMTRKYGTLLFHPELGLARTMLTALVDGIRYTPKHEHTTVEWDAGRRSVVIRWTAEDVEVTERLSVRFSSSTVVRDVIVSAPTRRHVEIEAALYANPVLFDRFGTHPGSTLHADGFVSMLLYSIPSGTAFERFLRIPARPAGAGISATLIYSVEPIADAGPVTVLSDDFAVARERAPAELEEDSDREASLSQRLERLYQISRLSLRATVSQNGRFDASVWQYGFEWGMDSAMVATAASTAGLFNLARQVLTNLLRRLTRSDGTVAEAGRFRDGLMAELNACGATLDAVWHYWRRSEDESLVRTWWGPVAAIAEFILRPEFSHPSGLLQSHRDFWERFPWMGVRRGFELGHQVFCAIGLSRAAEIAAAFGHAEQSMRWNRAADRIRVAITGDPTLSLVDDGRFVHRRLLDGRVQSELIAGDGGSFVNDEFAPYVPAGAPADRTARACEPDVTEVLPIIYGLVDPEGELASKTLDALESLWSPTGTGGYARYNTASDPDSPGPWPFATAFMAAAQFDAGRTDAAMRSLEWLIVRAGAGGSWFEFSGDRPTPPLPPVGIVVWAWAQYILLVNRHILGVDVADDELVIAPRMSGIIHEVQQGKHRVLVSVRSTDSARLDGKRFRLTDGAAHLKLPLGSDHILEFGS